MSADVILVAFDFDGTLAPIRDEPGDARMHRAAGALLQSITALPRVVVAIVSGRDADDLSARTNVSGAYIIGSHGLEIRAPGGATIRDSKPMTARIEDGLRKVIEAAGLRLEMKKHAVALHWRGVECDRLAAIGGRFRAWARNAGLDVIEGRCVVEARCRGGGKEEALRWLATVTAARRVLYAGDDLTDFGPLRFASENGVAFFVASAERSPPSGVTVVRSFRELLPLIRSEVAL